MATKKRNRKLEPPGKFLRVREVLALLGWSLSTLNRRIKHNEFPKPIYSSSRMRVWLDTVVYAWIAAQS